MRRALLWLVVALVVTGVPVAVALAATGGDDSHQGSSAQPFHTTALRQVDTSRLSFPRASFCADIDPRQVTAALGARASSQRSWKDGDRTVLSTHLTDVAHEFGCEYVAADGTAARAWVFAPPVGTKQATSLVASAGQGSRCSRPSGEPALGQPSVAVICTNQSGGQRASFRGLLDDAWLTCEVALPTGRTEPADQLIDRAGRWCAGVLVAAQRGADSSS